MTGRRRRREGGRECVTLDDREERLVKGREGGWRMEQRRKGWVSEGEKGRVGK